MTVPAASGRPSCTPEDGRPGRDRSRHARRPRRLAAAVAFAAGIGLAGTGTLGLVTTGPHRPAPADFGDLPITRAVDVPGPAATAAPVAPPLRIRIPGIGLDSPLTDLHVGQDGHLGAPADPEQIGWWSEGPRPGDRGAAVVVGHLDSLTGPAAFYDLSALRPGDTVTVDRADRSSVGFTVQALRQYDKDAVPDDQVYESGGPAQLRLITCGGPYDRGQHEYRDNLVVYATLAAAGATPSPATPRSGN